ncbi:MAG: thioredoxin family protein [Methanotrichaceae archaeon]|nr:thioredoxin family protein [Methanotrichaceae archaeon]
MNKTPFFVLDVYYPGCAPCKAMNTTTAELSTELGRQVTFGRINIRENKEIQKKYKVLGYPTLLFFSDGVLVNRLKGNTSKEDLVKELKAIEPKLDTSKVKTKPAPVAKNITNEVVPLAKVGERNPSLAMLVTDANLDQAVKKYPFLVVDMYADWCSACHPMNTTLSELAKELQGQVAFGLINGPNNIVTKQKYNITAYPTMLVFLNGELKDKMIGNQDKTAFVSELKKLEPTLDISKVKFPPPTKPAAPPQPKISPEEACAKMNKSENPVLEAYIVSRSPFGLQMQRIMYNVITKLPQAEMNMNVKYIGSVADGNITSMHGDEEARENLRQICIRDEQSIKYWDYVNCYMKEGKSEDCFASASIDKSKLQGCIDDSSRGIAYAKKDFDLADSYGITSSPILMMNNEKVSEFNFATNETNGRSPEAFKNLLCCGFKTKPSFCSTNLNASRTPTMFAI